MSIVSVVRRFQERGGNVTEGGTTLTDVFQVVTSDVTDGQLQVLKADAGGVKIPQQGDQYIDPATPTDPEAENYVAVTIVPRPDKQDQCTWLVTVTYRTIQGGTGGAENTQPWELKAVVNFDFQSEESIFDRAYSVGEPIAAALPVVLRDNPKIGVVNSAEMPFDPPINLPRSLLVISISLAIKGDEFDSTELETYQDTINSDQVTIGGIPIPPLSGYMRNGARTAFTGENIAFFEVNYKIVIRPETWVKFILDQGFYTATFPGGQPTLHKPILDTRGERIDDPALLDGTGLQLNSTLPGVFFEYHGLWEEAWLPLDLPTEAVPS